MIEQDEIVRRVESLFNKANDLESQYKEAMELIEIACSKHQDINTAEELVPLVYRLKQGIEV